MNGDMVIKAYIDGLHREDIPWQRMFTAYGTAARYNDALSVLEASDDPEEWGRTFNTMSDFEHQSTMFPPAPFALVFLVRILSKLLERKTENSDRIAAELVDQLIYYAEVCRDADEWDHAEPLDRMSDLLDEDRLLSADPTEEELDALFSDPDAVPDNVFYSYYYYSAVVLGEAPAVLDRYGSFQAQSGKLKSVLHVSGTI